jgi:hypothetical protein
MGVDLGQSQDYTAIVILERLTKGAYGDKQKREREHEWHLRDSDRLPLGTSYQDATKHIKDKIRRLEDLGGRVTLIVDSTGVGRPVIDSMKEDGLKPIAVTVTGGRKVVVENGEYHVPKRDLISAAKIMLGKRTLKIAKSMPYADVLVHELDNIRVKINVATGHDTYEAWREREHDDLVFAFCLACWWALQKKDFVSITDEVVTDTTEGAIHLEHDYRVGWVPSRGSEEGALVVYNVNDSSVVFFRRLKHRTAQDQIEEVFYTARRYHAAVWAHAEEDKAMRKAFIRRGSSVKRVEETKLAQAYENLTLLISYKQIKLPNEPGLLADIEAGNNSAVTALCLVTHDIHPEIEAKTYGFRRRELPDDVFSVLRGTRAYFDRINEKEEFDFDFDGETFGDDF